MGDAEKELISRFLADNPDWIARNGLYHLLEPPKRVHGEKLADHMAAMIEAARHHAAAMQHRAEEVLRAGRATRSLSDRIQEAVLALIRAPDPAELVPFLLPELLGVDAARLCAERPDDDPRQEPGGAEHPPPAPMRPAPDVVDAGHGAAGPDAVRPPFASADLSVLPLRRAGRTPDRRAGGSGTRAGHQTRLPDGPDHAADRPSVRTLPPGTVRELLGNRPVRVREAPAGGGLTHAELLHGEAADLARFDALVAVSLSGCAPMLLVLARRDASVTADGDGRSGPAATGGEAMLAFLGQVLAATLERAPVAPGKPAAAPGSDA
ncbi:hypothetical protein [Rhizosaccharibacter radicis]|uniref:DUF484 family protein n=1 Tax=Rhizosaccharibacter radicis TaxID=2782605 RepID=A0ABT1VZS9_9PROT|nr:hypothetical protein [Acetobacteraceae bacterium KSS12]